MSGSPRLRLGPAHASGNAAVPPSSVMKSRRYSTITWGFFGRSWAATVLSPIFLRAMGYALPRRI